MSEKFERYFILSGASNGVKFKWYKLYFMFDNWKLFIYHLNIKISILGGLKMARGKAKTTREKLNAALEKKEKLQNELGELKKEISRLEEQLRNEQMSDLVTLLETSGMTIEDVTKLIESNKINKLNKAI